MTNVFRMTVFRVVPVSLALCGLAGLSASAAPAAKTTIRGNVDVGTRTAGGTVLDVVGWAADDRTGAPVQKVEILFNDRVAAIAQLGAPRPDVAKSLGRKDFLRSGWNARVDLKKYPPGTYRLSARAFNAQGQSGPLAIAKVEIRIP